MGSSTSQASPESAPPDRRPGCLLIDTRLILGLVGAIALILVGLFFYERTAEANDASRYPPPGQRVDVGGYRLHINCTGQGSPTVVIDAALGEWSTLWAWVQPEAAKITRVCTYDRAGYGWSDPGPQPRNSQQIASELHTLLTNAGIQGPYILAGQGFGGFNVRVYAHDYPQEVAGVILVDADHVEQRSRFPSLTRDYIGSTLEVYELYGLIERFGAIRISDRAFGIEAPNLPKDVLPAYMAALLRSQTFRTSEAEFVAFEESAEQVQAAGTLGALPLIVLSNGLGWVEPDSLPSDFPKSTIAATNQAWNQMQAELLALSTHSLHMIAQNSHHSINLEQPGAIVEAISQMVKLTRR